MGTMLRNSDLKTRGCAVRSEGKIGDLTRVPRLIDSRQRVTMPFDTMEAFVDGRIRPLCEQRHGTKFGSTKRTGPGERLESSAAFRYDPRPTILHLRGWRSSRRSRHRRFHTRDNVARQLHFQCVQVI
jgi:hypothetical protein